MPAAFFGHALAYMARIRGHRNLNEDKTLYVLRRALVVDGKTFGVGDELPWRTLQGVTPRLLRLLHDQHKIGHERPAAPPEGAEDPQRAPSEASRAADRDEGRRRAARKPAPPGVRMG